VAKVEGITLKDDRQTDIICPYKISSPPAIYHLTVVYRREVHVSREVSLTKIFKQSACSGQVSSTMKRFVVFLLFCLTVVLTSEVQENHLEEEDWQNSLESSELQPENVADHKRIQGAPWGIKSFAGLNSNWMFHRCPLGTRKAKHGICRPVWKPIAGR
jgi:hypothetical protein